MAENGVLIAETTSVECTPPTSCLQQQHSQQPAAAAAAPLLLNNQAEKKWKTFADALRHSQTGEPYQNGTYPEENLSPASSRNSSGSTLQPNHYPSLPNGNSTTPSTDLTNKFDAVAEVEEGFEIVSHNKKSKRQNHTKKSQIIHQESAKILTKEKEIEAKPAAKEEPLPQPNEEPENDPSNHSSDSAFAENPSPSHGSSTSLHYAADNENQELSDSVVALSDEEKWPELSVAIEPKAKPGVPGAPQPGTMPSPGSYSSKKLNSPKSSEQEDEQNGQRRGSKTHWKKVDIEVNYTGPKASGNRTYSVGSSSRLNRQKPESSGSNPRSARSQPGRQLNKYSSQDQPEVNGAERQPIQPQQQPQSAQPLAQTAAQSASAQEGGEQRPPRRYQQANASAQQRFQNDNDTDDSQQNYQPPAQQQPPTGYYNQTASNTNGQPLMPQSHQPQQRRNYNNNRKPYRQQQVPPLHAQPQYPLYYLASDFAAAIQAHQNQQPDSVAAAVQNSPNSTAQASVAAPYIPMPASTSYNVNTNAFFIPQFVNGQSHFLNHPIFYHNLPFLMNNQATPGQQPSSQSSHSAQSQAGNSSPHSLQLGEQQIPHGVQSIPQGVQQVQQLPQPVQLGGQQQPQVTQVNQVQQLAQFQIGQLPISQMQNAVPFGQNQIGQIHSMHIPPPPLQQMMPPFIPIMTDISLPPSSFLNSQGNFEHPITQNGIEFARDINQLVKKYFPNDDETVFKNLFVHKELISKFERSEKLLVVRYMCTFYFSPKNLRTDYFLRNQMDEEGFVPVAIVSNFQRIVFFQASVQDIVEALQDSDLFELKDTDTSLPQVRPALNPRYWPLTPPALPPPGSLARQQSESAATPPQSQQHNNVSPRRQTIGEPAVDAVRQRLAQNLKIGEEPAAISNGVAGHEEVENEVFDEPKPTTPQTNNVVNNNTNHVSPSDEKKDFVNAKKKKTKKGRPSSRANEAGN